jgi:hypothetical protein
MFGMNPIGAAEHSPRGLPEQSGQGADPGRGTSGICTVSAIKAVLERIRSKEIPHTGKFETPNFHFWVYKNGTLYLWFRDLKALEMLNRDAAEREIFVLGSGK